MNRERDHGELIDLGVASDTTKGSAGPPTDEIGLFKPVGITDD